VVPVQPPSSVSAATVVPGPRVETKSPGSPTAERSRTYRAGSAGTAGAARTVGLTAPGVVVVVLAGSLVGLLLDTFTGGDLGWVFGSLFALSCVYAALQVRRSDLAAAAITPPLVFAALLLVHSLVGGSGGLRTQVIEAMVNLIDLAPKLWLGTGLAVTIVLVRWWRQRRR
jgi:hypothetical protein